MIAARHHRPAPSARRLTVGVALPLAVAALVAGCGLPTDENVQRYDIGDLSPALANTTTTSTTTTLPATSATAPPVESPPSTPAADATKPITVFYTLGLTRELQPYTVERATPVPLSSVIELLESPSGIAALGLRSSVRFGLIEDDYTIERGILTVGLDRTVLDRMTDSEERKAIAQMVLTFTSFVTADAGAIGSVRFEVDGQGYEVYVPLGGGTSEAGEALAYDDFKQLIVFADDADTPTGTTSTSVAPPAPTTPATAAPSSTTTATEPSDGARSTTVDSLAAGQ